MNKLVSRSLEILGKSVADVGKEYTSNVTSFINDAREVKNNIVKTTTDASDTFAKLKTTDITKKISDWFYGEENNFDASMGDDFDPGFKVDSSDEPKLDGEKSSRALDADSMGSITEKQTSMMLKIGRRQSEQSVANTAEIISVVNNRTSEMITSMNNINKTLIGISERIDKIIALQGVAATEGPKAEDKNALFQDGKLSLARIFDVSKQSLSNNSLASTASIFLQSLTSGGGFGPDALASLGLSLLTGRKMDTLGGHSIDDIGKKFNEVVGAGIQTALNEAINSGPFQKIFGNISGFNADQNYKDIVPNHYDTKRAMFDGMTRQSIVNVIPEMLAKINESISGNSYHLDNRGQWIKGPRKNEFAEVTQASFATANLSSRATAGAQRIFLSQQGRSVSDDDIKLATKALTMAIVMTKHYNGNEKGSFTISEFERDMGGYLDTAIKSLCTMRNDPAHWNAVCNAICTQLSSGLLDASAFVQNVNSSLDSMKKQAIAFAQSGKQNASQAGKLSLEMAAGQLFNEYRSGIKATQETDKPTDTPVVKKDDRSYELGRYGMGTYVKGIFGILNRGINVRVDKSGKKYEDYDINKIDPEKAVNTDDEFGKLFAQAMSGGGLFGSEKKGFQNMVKMGVSNKLNSLLGISDDTATGGVGGGGGFLSSLFGVGAGGLLSGAMRSVGESLFRGTFKEDTRKFFSDEGRGGQFINNTRDRVSTTFNNSEIGQSLAHDKRWIETKEYLTNDLLKSLSEKAKNTIGVAGAKIGQTGLYQKGYTLANNALYTKQSIQMNSAVRKLSNIDPSTIEDLDDRFNAEETLKYVNSGDLQAASESADKIKDEGLKKMITKHLGTISEIVSSRNEAETTIAQGGQASMGTVIQANKNVTDGDLNKSYQSGGVKGLIYTGFRFMGSVFRNTIGRSIRQIRYGAKAIFEGLFGGKLYNKNGQVVYDEAGKAIKQKGLFQLLITDTFKDIKGALGITGEGFKGTVSGLLDKAGSAGKGVKNFINDVSSGASQLLNKAADGLDKIGLSGLRRAIDKDGGLLDKFRETSFGRGFMSSFDRVNAKKEAAEKSERPFTTKKLQEISDAVTGKAKGENALSEQIRAQISSLLEPITENYETQIDETKESNDQIKESLEKSVEATKEPSEQIHEFLMGKGPDQTLRGVLMDVFEPIIGKNSIKHQESTVDFQAQYDKWKETSTDQMEDIGDLLKQIRDNQEENNKEQVEAIKESDEKADQRQTESDEKADQREEKSPSADVAKELKSSGGLKGLLGTLGKTVGGFFSNVFGGKSSGSGDLWSATTDGMFNLVSDTASASMEMLIPGGGDIGGDLAGLASSAKGGTGGTGGGDAAQAATKAMSGSGSNLAGALGGSGSSAATGGDPVLGAIFKRISGILEATGKIIGGIFNFVKGIVGAVISTALAMESFKAIKKVVNDILVDGVKPLNDAFEDIRDAIEPVADVVTEMLEEMMVAVNDTLEMLVAVIKPCLIDVIQPVLEEMLEGVLKPMFKDLLVPVLVALKASLPYIEMTAYSIEMVIGSIEFWLGMIMGSLTNVGATLGLILAGIGTVIKAIPGSFGEKLADNLMENGSAIVEKSMTAASHARTMMKTGSEHQMTGLVGIGEVLGQMFTGNYDYDKYKTDDKKTDVADTNEVNMARELGAGDVNTTTYNYSYMYGSGNTMNQHTYGSYMNMSERGCGPVVLADAYNRRSGGNMNPATLASTMLGAGAYDPARGTQTGDMIKTSGMLGMPLKMGGVTPSSLKKASPTNPITILGSGTGFGTKMGNNHYVNVVGTDANGGAYVANPMTGRVERQSASNLALNAKLGLYGAGDDDNDYGFDRQTTRAFEKLRELTDKLTGMFVDSSSSYIKKAQDEQDANKKYIQIKGSLADDEYKALEDKVIAELSKQNPKRDGETDEEYNNRIRALLSSPEAKQLFVEFDAESGENSAINRINKRNSGYMENQTTIYDNFGDPESEDSIFKKALSTIKKLASGSSTSSYGNDSLTAGTEEEQIFDYLRTHYGMSDAGAAGVMGVMQNEGRNHAATLEGIYTNDRDDEAMSYKTTADLNEYTVDKLFPMYARSNVSISRSGYNSEGEYLPGVGMAQWTGGRTRGLINYAKGKGKEWYDLKTQLDYIGEEKSGYDSLFDLLKNTDDPVFAADAWMTQYEAGCSGTNPGASWLRGDQISSRRTSAKGFYDKYNGRPLPSSSVDGSLIDKAAMVFEAAVNNNGGVYSYGDVGQTTLRDGTVLPHFRQDCSGLVSATIKSMGYGFNAGDNTGIRTYDLVNRASQDIVTKNGTISNDWVILPYTHGRLEPGDIITANEHMSIYMNGPDNSSWSNRGFDGGSGLGNVSSGVGIQKSADAGKAYLSGDTDWESKLPATHGGADGVRNILRYVGSGDSDDIPPVDQSLFDDLYSNLNNNGMSTIINKYNIKSDKQELDTILDKMGKMTFNVRAQRVEELLEELIEKVSDEKPKKPSPSNDSTDTNLFQNRPIPAQIQRLARG